MNPVRVLIVDDEELIREGLKIFIESAARTEFVGFAVDGDEAVRQAMALRPDVILMDMQMPHTNGTEATRAIVSSLPETKIIALTTFSAQRCVVSALQAGASGYLLKDTAPSALVDAVLDVHTGGSAISPQVSQELVAYARAADGHRKRDESSTLTERELRIVQLLGTGRSNAEIAAEMHLAEATVKAHFSRIMTKWGVRDRVRVLIHAARSGIVHLDDPSDQF